MNGNTGHGHVHPRPDGVKARCGGPAICGECAREYAMASPDAAQSSKPRDDLPLVVTKNGVPFDDQAEGLKAFKGACLAPPKPFFPGTASMYASQHKLAVTTEWMRGWNACLDEIDRHGGFTAQNKVGGES